MRGATWLLAAAAVVLALAGCAPGALVPGPSPAATQPRPDATATAAPSPEPEPAAAPVLLTTLAASDGLAIVDPDADEPVLDVVEVGQAPWGVAAAEGTAYVATAEGLAVVDLAARERTALVPYLHQPAEAGFGEYRDGGLGVAVSPDGAHVFVAVHRWPDPAWLEAYDVAEGAFTGSVGVGVRPFDVLADPDGEWVATIDHDSYTVSVVDAAALEAAGGAGGGGAAAPEIVRHEIAPFGNLGFAGWEKPHYAAITGDGRIALPYQGLVMVLLDPATGATERVPMAANSHSHGVTAAPDGRLVTVGTGAFGTATGAPGVSLLDPGTREEQVVTLERPHETAAIWQPDAGGGWQAVLAGGFTRDGWWDGLTVVDPASGAVREIALDGRPQAIVAAALPAP
ncbi:hypothetical protein OVA14_03590 [Agrococcus sp. SL85]|uniref:hypothetical protein n=1 Tax=Agrococcus sp. SL85 TaxID=2995141 RepID=UPI00226CDEA9|nr:hypothetical protein [Agrococcus sp. SL85]WAC66866.1 hypothetical protein OVA14_03590 [Agrococcus sp. SL85]